MQPLEAILTAVVVVCLNSAAANALVTVTHVDTHVSEIQFENKHRVRSSTWTSSWVVRWRRKALGCLDLGTVLGETASFVGASVAYTPAPAPGSTLLMVLGPIGFGIAGRRKAWGHRPGADGSYPVGSKNPLISSD